MGKQKIKRRQQEAADRPANVNAVNWNGRAAELVRLGICSPVVLDHNIIARRPEDQ